MAKEETVEIQKELFQEGGKLKKYQSLVLGQRDMLKLFKYEMITGLAGWMPGALGLFVRSKLYPRLLGMTGRNVTFGTGVVIRHPHKIFIGDNVFIADHCVLDAKGTDNRGIFIGDGVFIGRNTILNCKNGDIILNDNVNIGANCMLFSASEVRVGRDHLIAGYTYLVGGTHHFEDPLIPVLHQKRSSKGIDVGPGGWIGAHVTVFDGVHIGKHAVIGAGSAVHRNIPDYAIAGGNPVTIINKRKIEKHSGLKAGITIGVINYNNEKVLPETLKSIQNLNYPAVEEILFVDNCSTDNSIDLVRKHDPEIRILSTKRNHGPNPARNLALREARTNTLLLMDGDVVLEPDSLNHLEEALSRNPQAGVAGAQIRSHEDPSRIQYNGCYIHFAGGAVANPYDIEKPVRVDAAPGGAMLIDRNKAVEIGLFDEDFVFGWEDGDFTFRMTLAGYPCLAVSRAHVYHRTESKGIRWVRYQVRNRWWFILKNYYLRTLIVTLPAILIYQFFTFGFFLLKGKGFEYLRGTFDVLFSLPAVIGKHRQVMKIKKVKDKELLLGRGMDMMGDAGSFLMVRLMTRFLNGLFSIYWFFARPWVK